MPDPGDRPTRQPRANYERGRTPRWLRKVIGVALPIALVVLVWPLLMQWRAERAFQTGTNVANQMLEGIEASQRQNRELRAQQRIDAIRALGLASGAEKTHLIIDRDPGPLEPARSKLCSLARSAHGGTLQHNRIIVSIAEPRGASRIVGDIECPSGSTP